MGELFGHYFSKAYTSEEHGDLITAIKSDLNKDSIIIRKLTLVANGTTKIDINELGTYSEMFISGDGKGYLSLDGNDVLIRSLKTETAGISCFVAIIFA